jgi:hypothetical protein
VRRVAGVVIKQLDEDDMDESEEEEEEEEAPAPKAAKRKPAAAAPAAAKKVRALRLASVCNLRGELAIKRSAVKSVSSEVERRKVVLERLELTSSLVEGVHLAQSSSQADGAPGAVAWIPAGNAIAARSQPSNLCRICFCNGRRRRRRRPPKRRR